ncbi:DUF3631 domain-containing protein [Streptomyces bathyalis]|uniref:DUF3631 domain-containing protein n=1 Tax=Streptomyces bathyalis TaxID=2710756 RepID=A0A7T1T2H9_9ACTN|nr:DUF3631 domain-containing protein [Streptomyces bathyalis]QPP05167.1 DUF3631 domain-containing protein [Streptomyces bathyalis]
MTTRFPTILDALSDCLLDQEPEQENPRHRDILETYRDIQALDRRLRTAANTPPSGMSATEQLKQLTDLLVERLALGHVLTELLSSQCCCTAEEEEEGFLYCPSDVAPAGGILEQCLEVFADLGDPEAMASGDLVDMLRRLPGLAGGRWLFAELTQARLAQLLAPYDVQTRDITLPDGRRRKSYRRSALVSALRTYAH